MLTPYKTILLSEDETYPGLVTETLERFARVTWYKWGYKAPDTMRDIVLLEVAEKQIITAADCIQRFHDVPPQYNPTA